jgi:hypothetical protein
VQEAVELFFLLRADIAARATTSGALEGGPPTTFRHRFTFGGS